MPLAPPRTNLPPDPRVEEALKAIERAGVDIFLVTPALAAFWLKRNVGNRTLRSQKVDEYRQAWERGEWMFTGQGVAFDWNGTLVDGQHRLTFISGLPEGTVVPMSVTWGLDPRAFGALDRQIPRSAADVLRITRRMAACGRMLAEIYNYNQSFGITPQYLAPFIDWARDPFEALIDRCSSDPAVWSSAAFMAAAIVAIRTGSDREFVLSTYRALCLNDLDAMPPAAKAVVRQRLMGKLVKLPGKFDLFCRALRVFTDKGTEIQQIRVVSVTEKTAEVRAFLESQIQAPKIRRPDKRSKKHADPAT
jgi:hypothetical protein